MRNAAAWTSALKLVPLAMSAGSSPTRASPVAQMAIRLVVADDAGQEIPISTEFTDSDGRFGFLGIPAGRYVLRGTYVPRLPPEAAFGRGRPRVAGAACLLPPFRRVRRCR